MKNNIKFICCLLLLSIIFLLVACSDSQDNNDSSTNDATEEQDPADDENQTEDDTTTDDSAADPDENEDNDNQNEETDSSDDESSEEENEDNNTLSGYSSEEIEYARVWLQLGPNQDIDELYVEHIPAGTPLDPNDEDNDVSYPEDVIQVSGSRIADGMITYSGNGDGTINVYDIPYGNRWYGGMPRPDDIDLEDVKEDMREMLENPESIYIEPGDDEAIINIIEKMYIME
ncbi:hypothetical protein [Oceanobacillus jeddahense]|uniref:Lipoprotein n=1 Tax=Oceanobacillus jeddahense TaxID=1462527 RepID=A0ABY5K0N6_9BACI|nr:hypothetical protein [Oceanobacillus jeddahense]UUI04871.1 hypothetical protein NP439_09650 [Oceanobacillus jeddahense]